MIISFLMFCCFTFLFGLLAIIVIKKNNDFDL